MKNWYLNVNVVSFPHPIFLSLYMVFVSKFCHKHNSLIKIANSVAYNNEYTEQYTPKHDMYLDRIRTNLGNTEYVLEDHFNLIRAKENMMKLILIFNRFNLPSAF